MPWLANIRAPVDTTHSLRWYVLGKKNALGIVLWYCRFLSSLPWFNVWYFCFSSKKDLAWQINIWSQWPLTLEGWKKWRNLDFASFLPCSSGSTTQVRVPNTCFRFLEKCWESSVVYACLSFLLVLQYFNWSFISTHSLQDFY